MSFQINTMPYPQGIFSNQPQKGSSYSWQRSNNSLPFDTFQSSRVRSDIQPLASENTAKGLRNPYLVQKLMPNCQTTGEPLTSRVQMYEILEQALGGEARQTLKNLLDNGILSNNNADDNHSTLYHLYAILSTPRISELQNKTVLEETLRILNQPFLISQKFPKLSDKMAQRILEARNHPILNKTREPLPLKPLSWGDLNVSYSSDCVPASVMFYMASKQPSELARHIHELTSPLEGFYEKAKLSEICPEDPKQALEVLKYYDIPYTQSGADEVTIKVELPVAGKFRTLNDSQNHTKKTRSGIETAYQSALAYLVTRSYDPATGEQNYYWPAFINEVQKLKSLTEQEKNDLITLIQSSKSPSKVLPQVLSKLNQLRPKLSSTEQTTLQQALGEKTKGLTEEEKSLLETLIKDTGGISSVTYQVMAGKTNPKPDEEMQPFLYGYTRQLQEIEQDILSALRMGEYVIAGITFIDRQTGAYQGGHEITITRAFIDPKDKELKFVVADSDDNIPNLVTKTARELIPQIHHVGLPIKLAKKINDAIAKVPGYYTPDTSDKKFFSPPSVLQAPLPPDAFGPPPEEAKAV